MYEGEEKLTFAESEENNSRTEQVSEYTSDISTTIADGGGMRSGGGADGEKAAGKAILLRQTKAQDPKTKALLQAKSSITDFCEKLDIPERVRQKARSIFKAYLDSSKRKPKNANSDSMILAILYMALKEEGFTRDFSDLATVSKAEGDQSAQIKKSYSKLKKGLPNRETTVQTAASSVSFLCQSKIPRKLKNNSNRSSEKSFI